MGFRSALSSVITVHYHNIFIFCLYTFFLFSGGFYTCDDRYNPGKLLPHKWENCLTIDRNSWGFRRNARLSDFLTTHELIKELASTVSCGGNMLLNVGPTSDGRITPIFEERLRQMGAWLDVNGEAIYGSRPWTYQNDSLTPNIWLVFECQFLLLLQN